MVTLKSRSQPAEVTVKTKILVDATGPARAVMYARERDKPPFISGTGLEYLIEVDVECYQTHANALTFLLGHKWIPKGYSWVFPMEPNRLKVGAGALRLKHTIVSEEVPLKRSIELLLHDYLKPQTYKILDIHGATLRYCSQLQDVYYRDRVVAIGDAVSTVNFLGGEGIRHAMHSATIAAHHIQRHLNHQTSDFQAYQREMYAVFRTQWNLSERMGIKKYLQDTDELVDRFVSYLQPLSLEDVVDILFFYKFGKTRKGLGPYLQRKLTAVWNLLYQGLHKQELHK